MSHSLTRAAELLDKLTAQGSADQIALFLEQQKITGFPSSGTSCAIAQYLRHEMPLDYSVAVGAEFAAVSRQGYENVTVRLSEPVAQFVNHFDSQCYPNLLDPIFRRNRARYTPSDYVSVSQIS
jgi:hypothetical protein